MKIQAILFAVLQAQTVSSFKETPRPTSAAASQDRATICKARCMMLRFSLRKRDECIVKCGEEDSPSKRYNSDVEEEENSDADSQDDLDECAARCHKLRFGLRKRDECIAKCGEEDNPRKRYNSEVEEEEDINDDSQDNFNECKDRCHKLRFGLRKRDECITKCGEEDSPSKRYNSEVEVEEGSDVSSQDNLNKCMARCHKLRFGLRKRDECIARCDEEGSPSKIYSLGVEEKSVIDAESQENTNQCKYRCMMLRFGLRKRGECIAKCGEEDSPRKIYNSEVEEEEGSDADSHYVSNECEAHCHKLRFALRKQDECIAKCGKEDSPSKRYNSEVEEEEGSDTDPQVDPNECNDRCMMLRFSPRKRDECIAKCGEEDSQNKRYSLDAEEEEEGSDANSQDNTTSCEARCHKLRFDRRKRDECVAKCGEEDWYDQISPAEKDSNSSYSATE